MLYISTISLCYDIILLLNDIHLYFSVSLYLIMCFIPDAMHPTQTEFTWSVTTAEILLYLNIRLHSRVTLYTTGHLRTAVPHCSHSRAPIVHTTVPQENNEHGCVYLRCRSVCKLPGCVEGLPWHFYV